MGKQMIVWTAENTQQQKQKQLFLIILRLRLTIIFKNVHYNFWPTVQNPKISSYITTKYDK